MPVFTAAGRNVMYTLVPVCSPTPVARMMFFSVRCWITQKLPDISGP
jgi:hypothetical protein